MNRISYLLLLAFLFAVTISHAQSWSVTEEGLLPKAVSNNAVCEGFIDGVPYVFTFGGLGESKKYDGIHLNSYRFNTVTKEVTQIPDLPDTLGKVAAGASRVGDIIYIIGGYHVFGDGHELSSNKVHRYDIKNNRYLTDGAPIPVAIDDHVQAVSKEGLIYVVTGWSDKTNVSNVQIYDPATDLWLAGTSTPEKHDYKSFGASGVIINDSIYYFGGAQYAENYPIQQYLRRGVLNPHNLADITWSISTPNPVTYGYRMASTTVHGQVHWIGGSVNTYNYNGIAYDGSGGVSPTYRAIYLNPGKHEVLNVIEGIQVPMDLRGIASVNETVKYIIGGMTANQTVSNKVLRLEWK